MSVVIISVTDTLLKFLHKVVPDVAAEAEASEQVDMDLVFDAIEAEKVKGRRSPSLSELLKGTEVVGRHRKQEDLSHLSEIEILRLKADEKAYQRSVASVKPWQRDSSVGQDLRDMSSSISVAMQFFLAFIGAFAFGYYFVETFVQDDLALKVLAGGVCSFVTLLVESLLFIIRDNKNREKQTRINLGGLPRAPKISIQEKKNK